MNTQEEDWRSTSLKEKNEVKALKKIQERKDKRRQKGKEETKYTTKVEVTFFMMMLWVSTP